MLHDFEERFRSLFRDEPLNIERGIPRFVATLPSTQVGQTFSYKWSRAPDFGVRGETVEAMTNWTMKIFGYADEGGYAESTRHAKTILDAGCGNGRETIRLARLNPDALVVGLDLTDAVDTAAANAAGIPNVRFVQANLMTPPFHPQTFDHILSLGVMHHTWSTHESYKALERLMTERGTFDFYVYKQKAPIREFADDHLRQAIRSMTPEAAWAEMEGLSLLGKALSELHAKITVPEIKTLGIEAGEHDVQRLIYYTMLKCYWRAEWSLEDNTHINYDWYYPEYAHRHTAEEVREWIAKSGAREVSFVDSLAGLGFRVTRDRTSKAMPTG